MNGPDPRENRIRGLSREVRLGLAAANALFAVYGVLVLARAPRFGQMYAEPDLRG